MTWEESTCSAKARTVTPRAALIGAVLGWSGALIGTLSGCSGAGRSVVAGSGTAGSSASGGAGSSVGAGGSVGGSGVSGQCLTLLQCTTDSNLTCSGVACSSHSQTSSGVTMSSSTCVSLTDGTSCTATSCSINGVASGSAACSGAEVCETNWGGGSAACSMAKLLPSCAPETATVAGILDFNQVPPGSDVTFGDFMGSFSGVAYLADPNALGGFASDYSAMNWHITGTVKQASGFGIGFGCKTDASAFRGVSFDIGGGFSGVGQNDGGLLPGAALAFTVGTAPDEVATQYTSAYLTASDKTDPALRTWGTCAPQSAKDGGAPNPADGSCSSPSAQIQLTKNTKTVALHWSDLTNGTPRARPDPAQLEWLYWALPWDPATSTPYSFDIILDNLSFLTQ
jgi:hypothetical protein